MLGPDEDTHVREASKGHPPSCSPRRMDADGGDTHVCWAERTPMFVGAHMGAKGTPIFVG